MLRLSLVLWGILVLAACAGGESGPLPADQRAVVAYRDDGPTALTLITMVNNRTGAGGHSSLMVSGSQRVLFDPAGSFRPDWMTEHGDVLYGVTPRYFRAYRSAHSRNSHHVVTQTLRVSPEVAERALRLVEARGRVSSAFCANATSGILGQLPGFEDVRTTFYPIALMEQVALKPGVVTDRYFENDAGKVVDGIEDLPPLE